MTHHPLIQWWWSAALGGSWHRTHSERDPRESAHTSYSKEREVHRTEVNKQPGMTRSIDYHQYHSYLIVPNLDQSVISSRYEVGFISSTVIINAVHPLIMTLQSEVRRGRAQLPNLKHNNEGIMREMSQVRFELALYARVFSLTLMVLSSDALANWLLSLGLMTICIT